MDEGHLHEYTKSSWTGIHMSRLRGPWEGRYELDNRTGGDETDFPYIGERQLIQLRPQIRPLGSLSVLVHKTMRERMSDVHDIRPAGQSSIPIQHICIPIHDPSPSTSSVHTNTCEGRGYYEYKEEPRVLDINIDVTQRHRSDCDSKWARQITLCHSSSSILLLPRPATRYEGCFIRSLSIAEALRKPTLRSMSETLTRVSKPT
ncbi:hypothetical protein EV401DRAFT_504772 [Pisolithus croceorrhizus]|nr:hypothetical protein EV401DRAFT_504772 [Pisolithus croceorrhizus]